MKRKVKLLPQVILLFCCFFYTVAGQCPKLCRCDKTIQQVICTNISDAADLTDIANTIDNKTTELILQGNNISTFDANFKLDQLSILDLGQNALSTVPGRLNERFPNLEVLKLDNNQIDKLSMNDFNGLGNLRKLTFTNNILATLEDGLFQKLVNLKQLVVNSNQLSYVSKDAFKGLSRLVNLDLSMNKISDIEPGLFDHFQDEGISITFAENKLKTLPNGLLNKLRQLKTIEFSSNQITSIGDKVFDGVTISELLGLYNNSLQDLPVKSFLNSSIAIIQVIANPINCKCQLRGLFTKFNNKLYGSCKDDNSTIIEFSQMFKYSQDEIAKVFCTQCQVNNTCLNGASCIPIAKTSLHCKCTGGFYGSNCQHGSPCLSSPCKHSGTCTQINSTSEYNCFCKEEFYGKDCELVHDDGGLSGAEIAGVILGILFLIVLVIIILIFSKKHCERLRNKDPNNPSELSSLKKIDPEA